MLSGSARSTKTESSGGRSNSQTIRIKCFASVIEEFRRDPMLQTLTPGIATAWLGQMDAGVDLPASQESLAMAAEVLRALSVFRQMLKRLICITAVLALGIIAGVCFEFSVIAAVESAAGYFILI